MADTNRQKNAYMANEVDDDPFAELTRIMGFDPRVPMRAAQQPAAVAPRAAPIVAPATDIADDDLDFSMELEKELLGDFAEVTAANDAAPYRHAPEAVPQTLSSVAQPSSSASFQEPAFDEIDEDPQAYAQQDFAADSQSASDDQYAGDEYYADDFGATEPQAVVAYEPATAYQPAPMPAPAHGYEPVYVDAQSQQPELLEDELETDFLAAELDQALESSFESEFATSGNDDWWEEDAQVQPQAAPVAAAAPETVDRQPAYRQPEYRQVESRQADEFSADFDAAMAEVDMDFTAVPTTSRAAAEFELDLDGFDDELDAAVARDVEHAPRSQAHVSQPAAYQAQVAQVAAPVAPSVDAAFDDFDLDDDWQQAEAAAPQAVSREHEVAEAVEADQSDIDDAIAELAAMVRSYDKPAHAPVAPVAPVAAPQAALREDTPDIETVDIVESAVALADDLDIPELSFADDAPPAYDDLDAELAAAFGEPAMETVRPAPAAPAMEEDDFDLTSGYEFADRYAESLETGVAASAVGAAGAAYAAQAGRATAQQPGRATRQVATDEFDFDDHFIDDEDVYAEALPPSKPAPRRGMMIAAVVGGVALVGAVGAFAFSGGGSIGSGEPVLVKADTDPVKVKPANPGGVVVANQESSVFDPETGKPSAEVGTATQKALVSNEEAPVDVAAQFPDEAPQPIDESEDIESLSGSVEKSEDRVEQLVAADETAGQTDPVAVTPRKVRTMVVKPDGSLVPREEVAGAASAEDVVGSTSAATSLIEPSVSGAPSAEVPPATSEQTAAVAPELPAAAPAQPAPAAKAKSSVPDSGPLAPSRPADQPLEIVGEVKPQQVAAAASAAPAGAWSMQIASQPSEAAAQSSYQDLARRYSSVLSGRSANIVKAEIAGKGTFWRVRVPADSRNEAVSLCEKYKAAGGNCFVSR